MLIYDGVKPIQPRYHVVTDDATYCVEAYCCEISRDDGIILFLDNDSVQSMFRLDDVKAFCRVV